MSRKTPVERAIDRYPTSDNLRIFQDLNKYNMDHALKIRVYRESSVVTR